MGALKERSASLAVFGLTLGLLTVTLGIALGVARSLAMVVQSAARPKESIGPIVGEVGRALIRYGVLRTAKQLEHFEERATQHFVYLRGENFLNLLRSGFLEANSRFRILNDHPFSPFSEAVVPLLGQEVEIQIINAVPDQLYDPVLIDDRIRLASNGADYHLLPAKDIHLSIVVFDESVALVYSKPDGRDACSFAEALYTDDSELIAHLIAAFDEARSLASAFAGPKSSLDLLQAAKRVAMSGNRGRLAELTAPPEG